jgi:hypothetical protein
MNFRIYHSHVLTCGVPWAQKATKKLVAFCFMGMVGKNANSGVYRRLQSVLSSFERNAVQMA